MAGRRIYRAGPTTTAPPNAGRVSTPCSSVVASVANASTLKEHLIASHTVVEDCGRVAAAAGVKTLVLSHLIPVDDPSVTEQMWLDAARVHFRGTVVVAKDLLEI